jgi:hypothetical protein
VKSEEKQLRVNKATAMGLNGKRFPGEEPMRLFFLSSIPTPFPPFPVSLFEPPLFSTFRAKRSFDDLKNEWKIKEKKSEKRVGCVGIKRNFSMTVWSIVQLKNHLMPYADEPHPILLRPEGSSTCSRASYSTPSHFS